MNVVESLKERHQPLWRYAHWMLCGLPQPVNFFSCLTSDVAAEMNVEGMSGLDRVVAALQSCQARASELLGFSKWAGGEAHSHKTVSETASAAVLAVTVNSLQLWPAKT